MRLSTSVAGEGGDAVAWLHGYTLDSSVWAELWELLPGRVHVGIDLPGHGGSAWPGPQGGLAGLAHAVLEVMEHHRARQLVALSFGGLVAIELAIAAADRLDTLALSSPALGGGPQDACARERNGAIARLYAERGPGPWMTELWMRSPPDIFKGAERLPELYRSLCAAVDRHTWDELRDGGLHVYAESPQPATRLCRIRARTLVVIGEQDMPSFKRTGELVRRAVPGCRRAHVAGVGHLAALEAPTEMAALLEALWAGHPSTRSPA